jgi:hypothetical protein
MILQYSFALSLATTQKVIFFLAQRYAKVWTLGESRTTDQERANCGQHGLMSTHSRRFPFR